MNFAAERLDLSRWRDHPRGVWSRRWTIVSKGLELLLRTRLFRLLLVAGWTSGLAITAMGFLFGQSVASGGWLATLAKPLGPRPEAFVTAVGGFVVLYPDICVGGVYSVILWLQSFVALWLTLIAITMIVPRLVSRDRANNALTIYLSRPLTTRDYLLGKLGTIAGVIGLVWTGPLVFGWLASLLLAPNRDFVVYSLGPLARALAFNGIALASLAAIALGVSAVGRTSRGTIILWMALWLISGTLASAPHAASWIRCTSFTHDLSEIRQRTFAVGAAFTKAGRNLPILDRQFAGSLLRAGERAKPDDFGGAAAGLGILVVLSSLVFFRKLRPE